MPPDTVRHQKQDARQLAPEREHATETTVAARVSHRTKAALKQLAEQRGTDSSKLVARLIRQELARAGDEEHDTGSSTLTEADTYVHCLRIEQCRDGMMWYAGKVGELVPYLYEDGDGYWSCEDAGYKNIVRKKDASPVMCAPWLDYEGNRIRAGATIKHPSGESGTVVFLQSEGDAHEKWRVQYNDGTLSRLCLQVGDKGRAVVCT